MITQELLRSRVLLKYAGAELDVVKFSRFERGEGIEKRKDDLAAEIAAMQK